MTADALVPTAAPSRLPVTRWALRQRRRSLLLWATAVGAVSLLYMAFYPAMSATDVSSLLEGLPEAMRAGMGWDRIGSGAGYLESTVYALIAPALLLVFAVSTGARLVAGDEEAGTLELESTAPVGRRSVYLQRFLALALSLGVLCGTLAVVTIVAAPVIGMDVAATGVLAAVLGLGLFVLAMGAISFAVGAATGRRGVALGAGAALAVAAYMAHVLGPTTPGAAWLQDVSPFSWYIGGDPFVAGVDPARYGELLVLALVAVGLGSLRFERRDLGV